MNLLARSRDQRSEAAFGFHPRRSTMRNILKTTILAATLAATSALTIPSAHAEGAGMMRMNGGEGGMRREGGFARHEGGGWRRDGFGGLGGWGGVAAFLGGME